MKIIIDTTSITTPYDNITAYTASSFLDDTYKISNVRDPYPGNVWKAYGGTVAQLDFEVSKGSAVEIVNTNATSIVVTAFTGETFTDETGWSAETGWSYPSDLVSDTDTYTGLSGSGARLWADFTSQSGPFRLRLTLTASTVPTVGCVRSGYVETFKDTQNNHTESSVDYSIEMELNNGAHYFRKRDIARTFDNLVMVETRANAWKFKHDIFDRVGPEPLAIRLIGNTDITDTEFSIFAMRTEPPTLEHLSKTLTRISYSLQEVV